MGDFGKVRDMEHHKENITTIEELAALIQRRVAMKEDIANMATTHDVQAVRDAMHTRFDKVEQLLIAEHRQRIEKLKREVKELKELFAA
jgi:hypothetical protein